MTIAAGSTCIRLVNASPPRQGAATLIAAGDLLLIVQMQGAPMNVTNTECYGDNTDEAPAGCTASTTSGNGSGSTSRTAGLYEYVIATAAVTVGATNPCGAGAAITGDFVTVTAGTTGAGLINSYVSQRSAGGTGQTTYQVIRVPQYQTAQVGNAAGTATVTAAAWNGRSGGVVAFDVAGTLTVQTNSGANPPPAISVVGQGFRGGVPVTLAGTGSGTPADFDYRQDTSFPVHANKGEGIAGTPSTLTGMTIGATAQGYLNGDRARGAPGNAGGGGSDGRMSANDQNSGGGGGGNGGRGGKGGNAWNSNEPFGGWGGAPYTATATQLLMGGGGGGGTNNNNAGKSGGAPGGGMIFVRANTVTGTATFSANGNAAPDLEASAGNSNDSGGGGGAGGTITVLAATALPATLTLNASGGFGANANAGTACASDAHGPGGGGAGGVVLTSNTSPVRNVNGANPGLTNSIGAGGCDCPTPPANKVPAGTCIQYSAIAGTTGQLLTGTINSLPGVRTCVTSTRASLTGLRVGPSSVEFATACERDSLAFDVFATDDPSGQGARRRVGGSPLPARPATSVGPQVYRAEGGVDGAFVVIEEIERSGRRIRHGPFPADDGALLAALERAEEQRERLAVAERGAEMRRAAAALAAASASPTRGTQLGAAARLAPFRPVAPIPVPSVSAVRIETRGRGPVEVSLEALRAAGLSGRALQNPRRLRLTSLGLPVRFRVLEDDDHVPVALEFEAEPLETDYTDRNAYVVSLTGAKAPSVALTRSGFPRRPGTLRVETNSFYVPFVARAADPWLWAFLGAGPSQVAFDLPGLVAADGQVPVRVGLVGGSDHEHRVSVGLNGALLGEARFHGRTTAQIQALVPASVLLAAGNTLALTYDGGDDAAFAFLDVVDFGAEARVDPPPAVLSVSPYRPAPIPAGWTTSSSRIPTSWPPPRESRRRRSREASGHGWWTRPGPTTATRPGSSRRTRWPPSCARPGAPAQGSATSCSWATTPSTRRTTSASGSARTCPLPWAGTASSGVSPRRPTGTPTGTAGPSWPWVGCRWKRRRRPRPSP